MNELLEAALDYARRGWPVFPLASRSKKPFKGSHGFHEATTETSTIQRWWFENPRANVAIAPNGRLAILDVDPRNDGLESIRGRELPPTPTVVTGGGGYHYFFDSAGRRLASSKPLPGVELIASTGYVVAPPSVHPSGALYQWASELSFAEMPLAPMPAWLVESAGARGEGGAPRRASSYDGPRRPVFIELVLPGCFWLRHCRDDAATLAEWEWLAMLTIVGRCEGGSRLAHVWSSPYPRYSPKQTDNKLAHALRDTGPMTCRRIARETRERWCRDCPAPEAGVTSPINLGDVRLCLQDSWQSEEVSGDWREAAAVELCARALRRGGSANDLAHLLDEWAERYSKPRLARNEIDRIVSMMATVAAKGSLS